MTKNIKRHHDIMIQKLRDDYNFNDIKILSVHGSIGNQEKYITNNTPINIITISKIGTVLHDNIVDFFSLGLRSNISEEPNNILKEFRNLVLNRKYNKKFKERIQIEWILQCLKYIDILNRDKRNIQYTEYIINSFKNQIDFILNYNRDRPQGKQYEYDKILYNYDDYIRVIDEIISSRIFSYESLSESKIKILDNMISYILFIDINIFRGFEEDIFPNILLGPALFDKCNIVYRYNSSGHKIPIYKYVYKTGLYSTSQKLSYITNIHADCKDSTRYSLFNPVCDDPKCLNGYTNLINYVKQYNNKINKDKDFKTKINTNFQPEIIISLTCSSSSDEDFDVAKYTINKFQKDSTDGTGGAGGAGAEAEDDADAIPVEAYVIPAKKKSIDPLEAYSGGSEEEKNIDALNLLKADCDTGNKYYLKYQKYKKKYLMLKHKL